jgi:alginate O-acetyltransferase complex protein AlgI
MSIDSALSIALFIPGIVAICALLRTCAPAYVPSFLLVASLAFYAMSDWQSAWLIVLLMGINLTTLAACERWPTRSWRLVSVSILLHLTPLALWKYVYPGPMPFGLSFVTFLLISALLDIRSGAPRLGLIPQSLHALFFASVTAGPITRYKDLAPQLKTLGFRPVANIEILRGASLMVIGLAKISLVGRPIRDTLDGILIAVNMGIMPTIIEAWYVAVGGFISLYFLFSGYSDIALGVGMMVGLRLSANFDSPFKARSGADFISRWHKTLMDWIRAYVFVPLTRAVMSFRFGTTTTVSFVAWAAASLTSFTIIGAWHGGSWPPILAGFVSGAIPVLLRFLGILGFKVINFRAVKIAARVSLLGVLTLLSLPILIQDFSTIKPLMIALVDFDSFSLGQKYTDLFLKILPKAKIFQNQLERPFMPNASVDSIKAILFLTLGVTIVFLFPNSLQIFDLPNRSGSTRFVWRPSVSWGAILGLIAVGCVVMSSQNQSTGFVYDAF